MAWCKPMNHAGTWINAQTDAVLGAKGQASANYLHRKRRQQRGRNDGREENEKTSKENTHDKRDVL